MVKKLDEPFVEGELGERYIVFDFGLTVGPFYDVLPFDKSTSCFPVFDKENKNVIKFVDLFGNVYLQPNKFAKEIDRYLNSAQFVPYKETYEGDIEYYPLEDVSAECFGYCDNATKFMQEENRRISEALLKSCFKNMLTYCYYSNSVNKIIKAKQTEYNTIKGIRKLHIAKILKYEARSFDDYN